MTTSWQFLQVRLIALLTVLAAVFLHCEALAQERSAAGSEPAKDLLVDAQWVTKRLYNKDIIVVDTRDASVFELSHIERAVNIPVVKTFSQDQYGDMVAPISVIQSLIGNAGIDNNNHVVLYDNGEHTDAARVFWVFEVYGHKNVSLLNGGFENWTKLGLPVSTETIKRKAKKFIPAIVPEKLSTKFSTRLAMNDSSKILIDARTPDEYEGKVKKYSRAGHIPSAINIPSNNNIDFANNGIREIKSLDELKSIYGGIDTRKKVITYCNRGKESALTYFILRRLGYSVSAYDGSWSEWSRDPSLPVYMK